MRQVSRYEELTKYYTLHAILHSSCKLKCSLYFVDRGIDRIPGVQLVLGGDPGSILKVLTAVKQKFPMPVVVFKGSGAAADLLAYAVRLKCLISNIFF